MTPDLRYEVARLTREVAWLRTALANRRSRERDGRDTVRELARRC